MTTAPCSSAWTRLPHGTGTSKVRYSGQQPKWLPDDGGIVWYVVGDVQAMWYAPSSVCCAMTTAHCAPSTVPASPLSLPVSTGAGSVGIGSYEASRAATLPPPQPATSASRLPATTRHGAIDFTLALPLLRIFTFVPGLLAVDERQFGLHPTLLL